MLTRATTLDEALAAVGEYRAGGTDLQERRRSGVSCGPLIDISGLPGLGTIDWLPHGGARIGALVPIAAVASDERLRVGYPGLAGAAAALATPQIRAVGTLGGNLTQRTRCWYYRQPGVSCVKKGGDTCPARAGNHFYGVCFDLGPCVWPHPSTLGAALLAYDACVETHPSRAIPVGELFGDGTDGRSDHRLHDGQIVTAISLPAPTCGERAAYFRAISRTHAEWPLVEAIARVVVERDVITLARIAVGGVAPVPLRLTNVETALTGRSPTSDTIEVASALAGDAATPLPATRYKVTLLAGSVREALERAVA